MSDVMLTLIVPVALEGAIVDWLLDHIPERGFTSSLAFGHSEATANMSLAEQVSGRRRGIRFEVVCCESEAGQHIEALRETFAESGIHFWLMPIMASGRLASPASSPEPPEAPSRG